MRDGGCSYQFLLRQNRGEVSAKCKNARLQHAKTHLITFMLHMVLRPPRKEASCALEIPYRWKRKTLRIGKGREAATNPNPIIAAKPIRLEVAGSGITLIKY
jgi:hypothetical protein